MKAATIALIAANTMTLSMAASTGAKYSVQQPEYEFETYKHLACRGPAGKHDNKSSYYKRIRAYPNECRERCEDDDYCTGYETGKNRHCELWNAEIGMNLQEKYGLTCDVKANFVYPMPIVPTYNVYKYEVEEGRACRGSYGKHDNDQDYYELKKLSGPECRIACDYNKWCTGYETGRNDRCELWSEYIGLDLPKKRNVSCYIKTDDYKVEEYKYPEEKYAYTYGRVV